MQHIQTFLLRSLLLVAGFSLLAATFATPLVGAQSAQRDCDENAVLKCGGYTTAEINQKYDSQAGAKAIFSHFGISSSEVNALHGTAVSGHVTKGGRVLVDGKTVATDAVTAGRQHMPGSTQVSSGGTTFYSRPPSASFSQDKLDAYVVMKNGVFQFAIIKSCGNPVKATPVPKEKPPAPKPKPPAPKPIATPPAPVPSAAECTLLNVAIKPNRAVVATVNSSANNATVTGYTVDFGDGSSPSVLTGSSGNASQEVTHTYARDGTYTITATIQVLYPDGRTESKTAETCKKAVTIATPPIVPAGKTETPTPPPVLPATGPLEVVGVSAAMAVASSIGYLLYGRMRSLFGL